MKKLVYIAGIGHNGSTMLDLLLDKSSGITSLGQLNELFLPYDPRYEDDPRRASFWRSVQSKLGPARVDKLRAVNSSILKEKRIAHLLFSQAARREFSKINSALLGVIAEALPDEILLDSSKNVSRCLGLTELSDFELYVVHLVRDIRGYVSSYNKRRREIGRSQHYFRPSATWFLKNIAGEYVGRSFSGRYLHVSFEQLTDAPTRAIDEIERFLEHDLTGSRLVVNGSATLDPASSLAFGGNRILHRREPLAFRRERTAFDSATTSLAYWLSQGWVARRWGYRYRSSDEIRGTDHEQS